MAHPGAMRPTPHKRRFLPQNTKEHCELASCDVSMELDKLNKKEEDCTLIANLRKNKRVVE